MPPYVGHQLEDKGSFTHMRGPYSMLVFMHSMGTGFYTVVVILLKVSSLAAVCPGHCQGWPIMQRVGHHPPTHASIPLIYMLGTGRIDINVFFCFFLSTCLDPEALLCFKKGWAPKSLILLVSEKNPPLMLVVSKRKTSPL